MSFSQWIWPNPCLVWWEFFLLCEKSLLVVLLHFSNKISIFYSKKANYVLWKWSLAQNYSWEHANSMYEVFLDLLNNLLEWIVVRFKEIASRLQNAKELCIQNVFNGAFSSEGWLFLMTINSFNNVLKVMSFLQWYIFNGEPLIIFLYNHIMFFTTINAHIHGIS